MQLEFLAHLFGKKEFYQKPILIKGFHGDEKMKSRLMEIGLYSGCEITILGQSPFNGPLMIQSGPAIFCLRREEAQCIQIAIN